MDNITAPLVSQLGNETHAAAARPSVPSIATLIITLGAFAACSLACVVLDHLTRARAVDGRIRRANDAAVRRNVERLREDRRRRRMTPLSPWASNAGVVAAPGPAPLARSMTTPCHLDSHKVAPQPRRRDALVPY